VSNKHCLLVFFHGFGFADDIHNFVQNIEHISPPEIHFQQGAGSIKHLFADSNQYLMDNFSDQEDKPVILFPSKKLTKEDGPDEAHLQRLLKRSESY
jgi:hypothetical protein